MDPITASYPMLTPYQFASNRPIDGIDLDGLEYLAFHKSMYRLGYMTETTNAKTGGGKTLTMTSSRSILNTVYGNIPAALQEPKTQSFQFVAGGPASQLGRDYTSSELTNIAYDKSRYFVNGKFYGTADGDHDPDATASTSGMGGNAINQGRANGVNAAGSALGEDGAGVVKNMFNSKTWNALAEEKDLRNGFYNATNMVNYYIQKGLIGDKSLTEGSGRIDLINFLSDGFLNTEWADNLKDGNNGNVFYNYSPIRKNVYGNALKVAYTGLQIMQRKGIEVRSETRASVKSVLQKYKENGGDNTYDDIDK